MRGGLGIGVGVFGGVACCLVVKQLPRERWEHSALTTNMLVYLVVESNHFVLYCTQAVFNDCTLYAFMLEIESAVKSMELCDSV